MTFSNPLIKTVSTQINNDHQQKPSSERNNYKATSETHKHDVISLKISSWTSKYINAKSRRKSIHRGYSEGQRGVQKMKFAYLKHAEKT